MAHTPLVNSRKPRQNKSALGAVDQRIREALAAFERGDFHVSQPLFQQVLKERPHELSAHACLATISFQRGNLAKSFAHYLVLESFGPEYEPTIRALTGISGLMRDFDGLAKYLDRLADVTEKSLDLDPLSIEQQALFLEFALRLFLQDRPEGIEAVCRVLMIHNTYLGAAVGQAFQATDTERTQARVLAICKAAANSMPQSDEFACVWASWLCLFGKDEEALEVLGKSIDTHQDCWRSWVLYAELASKKSKSVELKQRLDQSLGRVRLPDETYCILIADQIRQARFGDAEHLIQQSAIHAQHPEVINAQRIILLYAQGRPRDAHTFALGLAKQYPEAFEVQIMYIELLITLAYFKEAGEVLARLLLIRYDYKRVLIEQASLYAAEFRFDESKRALETLLKGRPSDKSVMGKLMLSTLLDGDVDGAVALDRTMDDLLELEGRRGNRLNWRHDFERSFLKEFHTNRYAMDILVQARRLPSDLQVAKLLRGLEQEPGYVGFAIMALVRLRQSGAMKYRPSVKTIEVPLRVSQYWDHPEPPDEISQLMTSWRTWVPHEAYRCFNDQSAWDFLKDHSSAHVLRAFESSAHPTLRADLLRLSVLAVHGGVWGDADDRCCESLEPLIQSGEKLVLLQEPYGTLGNNFIASVPNHPFINYALERVARNILDREGRSIWFISGPGALTLVFCQYYSATLKQLKLPAGVRIIDTHTLSRTIAQHLPLAYKHQGSHWNHTSQRQHSLFRKPMGRPNHGKREALGPLALESLIKST